MSISVDKQPGIVVRCPADHDCVHVGQMVCGLFEIHDAAVDLDGQVGEFAFETVHFMIAQWWFSTILFGGKSLEPGFAGVDAKPVGASTSDNVDESRHVLVGVHVVNANAMFNRNRNRHRGFHGRNGFGDNLGRGHEAGTKTALLHPARRTADIEIDLVVAPLLANAGAFGKLGRIVAAQLQGNGMLNVGKVEVALPVAEQDGARGNHFAVQQRAAGDVSHQEAKMTIRSVHHRRYAEWGREISTRLRLWL